VFAAIFITLFVAAWLILGFFPWLALSVATRGNAGLGMLPLSMLTGVVAGLSVPLLGKDDGEGIWISMIAALVAPCLLLAVRRFSLMGHSQPRTVPRPE
jgi:hypothetical protein